MQDDLRTAALFEYLGKKNVLFLGDSVREYQILFYNPQEIADYEFDNESVHIIITATMKSILYSTNFETTPLSSSTLEYYEKNIKNIYKDKFIEEEKKKKKAKVGFIYEFLNLSEDSYILTSVANVGEWPSL